jgi:hypothetical protein
VEGRKKEERRKRRKSEQGRRKKHVELEKWLVFDGINIYFLHIINIEYP